MNIFLADLFFNMNDIDISSQANDNTPYIVDNTDDEIIIIKSLEEASATLLQWFANNFLKNNSDKCCHLLISSNEM